MNPDQAAIDIATVNAGNFVTALNTFIVFPLIGLLSAVAFLVFLWGCAEYIMNANNSTARTEGVKHITFGIIGLVVMMSAWAILSIAAATFGLDDNLNNAKNSNVPTTGTAGGASPPPTPGTPGGSQPPPPVGTPGGSSAPPTPGTPGG